MNSIIFTLLVIMTLILIGRMNVKNIQDKAYKYCIQNKQILSPPLLFAAFILLTAGHHFETKLSKKYPALDANDIYVFESSEADKTVFILSLNPQSKANAATNFAENGIYSFHIGFNQAMTEGMSMNLKFKDGQVKVYAANKVVPEYGAVGKELGSGPINKTLNFNNGVKLWTGASKDPFPGNATGISKFKEDAGKGVYNLGAFDVGEKGNFFSTLTSSIIAFEIPNNLLPENIYYFASTAVMEEGEDHWHGVNSIGHVLFPHMYMEGDALNTKKNQLRHQPTPELRAAAVETITKYATLSKMQKDPVDYAEKMADIILPDVLSYKVGSKANYGVKVRNGRHISDDAMNVALAMMLGSDIPISDQVSVVKESYQANFPYVVPVDDAFTKSDMKSVNVTSLLKDFGYKKPAPIVKKAEEKVKEVAETGSNMLYYILGGLLLLGLIFFFVRKK